MSTECSCCSLHRTRHAPLKQDREARYSQVLRGQHVLADALRQGLPAAAGIDAARAALRPQVLQHQRPQVVVDLHVTGATSVTIKVQRRAHHMMHLEAAA